jgi:hexulose-6-phosphate isomerase
LIDRCARLGANRIVLPFVDNSAITSADKADRTVDRISRALNRSAALGLELHLETSLPPGPFADLLHRLPDDLVRVTYDIGNSASLGHEPLAEFSAYGGRIGSVHVKDRVRNGGSVPLGTGDADLPLVFESLRRVAYEGDFVLQVARGVPGDELDWITRNAGEVRAYLDDRMDAVR